MKKSISKIILFFTIILIIFCSIPGKANSSQAYSDSIGTKLESEKINDDNVQFIVPKFKLGIGVEISQPTIGITLNSYYKSFGSSLTYGFSKSTKEPKERITDIKNSLQLKVFYCFVAWYAPFFYNPIYAGIGYNQITEKENVQGFTGNGTIKGFNYFIGLKFLKDTRAFFKHFGGHIEIGFNKWDFNESLLVKNNSAMKYNYPNIYFNLGLYYYIY